MLRSPRLCMGGFAFAFASARHVQGCGERRGGLLDSGSARCARREGRGVPSPGTFYMAGASPVPVRPGADVAGVSPDPVQMWAGREACLIRVRHDVRRETVAALAKEVVAEEREP